MTLASIAIERFLQAVRTVTLIVSALLLVACASNSPSPPATPSAGAPATTVLPSTPPAIARPMGGRSGG